MTRPTSIDVLYVERLPNSRLGNPRWALHTTSKSWVTAPDISDSHMMYADFSGRLYIETNQRGRVVTMRPVEPVQYDPTGARIVHDPA